MAMHYSPPSNLAPRAAQSGARTTGGALGSISGAVVGSAAGQSNADDEATLGTAQSLASGSRTLGGLKRPS
jgi:hypothetical protein